MNITAIRTLQTQLKTKGFDPGTVDGNLSAATRSAIAQALNTLNPNTKTAWRTWPSSRQTVLCLQTMCLDAGVNPGALDGWVGSASGTSLSTHSWGIAFDFDPARNKLQWGRDRATYAKPEYDAWWRSWEAEGWVSLGRTKNYDWMHVQAARV